MAKEKLTNVYVFAEENTTTRVRGKLENMGVWHSGNCGGL